MSVEFHDYSLKVLEALNSGAIKGLELAAVEIESHAKRHSPRDTNTLRDNWDHVVDESRNEAKVGNPLENAIWSEFGTGEYALEGKGRKGAWYVPVEKVTGKKKPTYNGQVVIVYGQDGQAFYKTNGKRPNRTLLNAFVTKKKTAENLIRKEIAEAMK